MLWAIGNLNFKGILKFRGVQMLLMLYLCYAWVALDLKMNLKSSKIEIFIKILSICPFGPDWPTSSTCTRITLRANVKPAVNRQPGFRRGDS